MKQNRDRVIWILETLSKLYTNTTMLHFENSWQLVVATILSAQSRDVKVNEITEVLFKKYKTPQDFSKITQNEMEQKIKSINYFKTKALRIREASQMILSKFHCQVPDNMKDLLSIPGIARKSANVILSSAFHKDEGVVVDTHVSRLSQRLGLTKEKTAEKIEKDLMKLVPKKEWGNFSHYLIYLGREVCASQKPKCKLCVLSTDCPSINQN
jgi:endonuclease III